MKNIFLIVSLLVMILSANAQETNNDMETIFSKKLNDSLAISQVRNGDSWIKIVLTNTITGVDIELERIEYKTLNR